MISLDCETTGVDLQHGAKPFLVTTCDGEGNNSWWEWDVDPMTRQPIVPEEDVREIEGVVRNNEIVFQNPRFDVRALEALEEWSIEEWPWEKTYDTLIAAHLLASNQFRGLTTLALVYLGINVQPFEDVVKKACQQARSIARRKLPEWRIAKKGLEEMPSVKASDGKGKDDQKRDAAWKNDLWLPRAFVKNAPELLPETEEWKQGDDPEAHDWATCTAEYANSDSAVTLPVFKEQWKLIVERGLEAHYEARREFLPVVYRTEGNGVTLDSRRLEEMESEFREDSEAAGRVCVGIGKDFDHELELPKNGNNKSLLSLCFDEDKLNLPVIARSKKTGAPSLDKDVKETLIATLSQRSKQRLFVKKLALKSKRDTALSYMEGYRRFWKELDGTTRILYPSLNPTGTDTLRLSSSNPNEQNISKKEEANIRYCFGPGPGREWWALDYDNLELRIPAYECEEPAMLELFENPTAAPYFGSYHLLVFSILHPNKYDHDDPEGLLKAKKKYATTWYQWTKNGNFAVQYGAIAKSGTADRAYHVRGGQTIVEKRLSEISKLNSSYKQHANAHGFVYTLPDKEVNELRGYPLSCTRSEKGYVSPTIPLSYHIQGTACWIMMRAMVKVQEYLDRVGPEYKIIMNVHDEIVLDFPYKKNKGNSPIIRKVRRIMEERGDCVGVKLTSGVDYHPNNWSVSV